MQSYNQGNQGYPESQYNQYENPNYDRQGYAMDERDQVYNQMDQGTRGSMQKRRGTSKSRSKSGLRDRKSSRYDQYSQGTQRQQEPQKAYTRREQNQQPVYADQYYQEEDGMRPTLKQEDYHNAFGAKQKYPNKQRGVDDSNFEDTDEEQVVMPNYSDRERQVLEHQKNIANALFDQSAVQPQNQYGEFAEVREKPTSSKKAYAHAQKARQRSSSRTKQPQYPVVAPARIEVSPRNTKRQQYREKTPEQMPIVTATHRKSEKQKFQPRDIKQIQEVINKDYEDKLRAVNEEAHEKLKRVQKEHQKVLHDQQKAYYAKKEQEKLDSYYNDLENNYNQIDSRRLSSAYDRPEYQSSRQEQPSLNSQNLSFLNGSYNKVQQYMPADSRQSRMSGGELRSKGRNYSINTIQMLDDADYEPKDLGMDMLNVTNYSTILNQEQNPEKLRAFYKQYANAIKNNKRKGENGEDEVNLLDLLGDLRMIAVEGKSRNRNTAVATSMIKQQRYKFYVPIQPDQNTHDDVVKNLFKILCGVNNMRLQQRGQNPMDDKILNTYLDAINMDINDDDIVLLNQLATIKSLAKRRAFSINDKQISMIHKKFLNLFDQRSMAPVAEMGSPQVMRPSLDARKNAVDRRQSLHRLPRELEQHELEESREYRHKAIELSSERGGISGRNTNRSRADSLIGKGSRYASPARAERRDTRQSQGGGGAITNNYYRNASKNNSYVSDPVSAPTNYSQNVSNAGRGLSPPKEAKNFGDIQEFLNRLPAKTSSQLPDNMAGKVKRPHFEVDRPRSRGSNTSSKMSHGGYNL